jgi:hypothetical protein
VVDVGSISNIVAGYAKTSAFWLTLSIVLVAAIALIYGWMSRKSKLKYNCLEVVRYGNGKIGLNSLKAGYLKRKTFMHLFDYGNEKFIKTSDNRVIEKAKTSQLHDIFGKKGFICLRSPKDPKVLVPISKVEFDNLNLLFEIAPGDYRDTAVRIFNEAVEETKGTWERILPYVMVGLCIFLCIITIVIVMQMTNHATDKVGQLLINGCSNAQNVKPSGAP